MIPGLIVLLSERHVAENKTHSITPSVEKKCTYLGLIYHASTVQKMYSLIGRCMMVLLPDFKRKADSSAAWSVLTHHNVPASQFPLELHFTISSLPPFLLLTHFMIRFG